MEQPEKPEGKNRTGFTTGTSATAASIALFPCLPPDLSIACCTVLSVSTQNIQVHHHVHLNL